MRVWAISDLHLDYSINRIFFHELSAVDYLEDILILAGDIHHEIKVVQHFFEAVRPKFKEILFVPGNHDVWITAADRGIDSMQKYHQLLLLAKETGIQTNNYQVGSLTIVPLHSWYDFTFGQPSTVIRRAWRDFEQCKWTNNDSLKEVTNVLLGLNLSRLTTSTAQIISFSHFLPYANLIPDNTPPIVQALKPVMGCRGLGEQIQQLKPQIHLYGHSHLNRKVGKGNTVFINNAYGYPKEKHISRKRLLCIYEQGKIIW